MIYLTHKQMMYWPMLATMPPLRDLGNPSPLKWTMEKCRLGKLRAGRVLASAKNAGFVARGGGQSWVGNPVPPFLRNEAPAKKKVARFRSGSYADLYGQDFAQMPKLQRNSRDLAQCACVEWATEKLSLSADTAGKVIQCLFHPRYPFVLHLGGGRYKGTSDKGPAVDEFFAGLKRMMAENPERVETAGNAKQEGLESVK